MEYNIKTGAPKVQKQELNYKENKLQCTVFDPEAQSGMAMLHKHHYQSMSVLFFTASGFTLLKKKKNRSGSQDAGNSQDAASDSTPLTPSREAAQMQLAGGTNPIEKQEGNDKQSFDHSLTTAV